MNDTIFTSDEKLAEWLKDTIIAFGGSIGTAYKVAGMFVEAVNNTRRLNEQTDVEGGDCRISPT